MPPHRAIQHTSGANIPGVCKIRNFAKLLQLSLILPRELLDPNDVQGLLHPIWWLVPKQLPSPGLLSPFYALLLHGTSRHFTALHATITICDRCDIGVVGIANIIGNGLPMMLRLLAYWQQHWQPAWIDNIGHQLSLPSFAAHQIANTLMVCDNHSLSPVGVFEMEAVPRHTLWPIGGFNKLATLTKRSYGFGESSI